MKRPRIYISGAIATDKYYKKKFKEAYEYLTTISWDAVNPAALPDAGSWEDNMRRDIAELVRCDALYALSDWRTSRGATIEVQLARRLGLKMVYENLDHDPDVIRGTV